MKDIIIKIITSDIISELCGKDVDMLFTVEK